MKRLGSTYIRHAGRQIPLYCFESENDALALEKDCKNKKVTIIREYTQTGVDYDLSWGIFERPDGQWFAVQVITEGGFVSRLFNGAKKGELN